MSCSYISGWSYNPIISCSVFHPPFCASPHLFFSCVVSPPPSLPRLLLVPRSLFSLFNSSTYSVFISSLCASSFSSISFYFVLCYSIINSIPLSLYSTLFISFFSNILPHPSNFLPLHFSTNFFTHTMTQPSQRQSW